MPGASVSVQWLHAIIVCCISKPISEGSPRLPELRKDPITGRWVIIATDRVVEDDRVADGWRAVERAVVLAVDVEAPSRGGEPGHVGADGGPDPYREVRAPVLRLPAVA